MNIVSAAAGTFFQHKGLAQDQKEFAADHFREAIERYEEALESDPRDKTVLFYMALTWYTDHLCLFFCHINAFGVLKEIESAEQLDYFLIVSSAL